jgi:uncharacterized protein YqgC (DUF456 family)
MDVQGGGAALGLALLALAQVVGLVLIPFGLPGIWLQVLAACVYGWFVPDSIGWVAIAAVVALAVVAEVVEFALGGRYARKYGGGNRAAWGAILGGIVGAVVGVPIFLVGSVIGAFIGAFLGAALGEYTVQGSLSPALRAGWGAFLGRLAATAAKSAIGVVVAAIALISPWI